MDCTRTLVEAVAVALPCAPIKVRRRRTQHPAHCLKSFFDAQAEIRRFTVDAANASWLIVSQRKMPESKFGRAISRKSSRRAATFSA